MFAPPDLIKNQIFIKRTNIIQDISFHLMESVRKKYEKENPISHKMEKLPEINVTLDTNSIIEIFDLEDNAIKLNRDKEAFQEVCDFINEHCKNEWLATFNQNDCSITIREFSPVLDQEKISNIKKLISQPIEFNKARGFGTIDGKTAIERMQEHFSNNSEIIYKLSLNI